LEHKRKQQETQSAYHIVRRQPIRRISKAQYSWNLKRDRVVVNAPCWRRYHMTAIRNFFYVSVTSEIYTLILDDQLRCQREELQAVARSVTRASSGELLKPGLQVKSVVLEAFQDGLSAVAPEWFEVLPVAVDT
jgi:hypothetical protein